MFAVRKPVSLASSLLVHGAILAWVASGPVFEKPDAVYQQLIAPHASKLIWYDFREKLPDVSPTAAPVAPKPLRAEKIAAQEIVAGSPKAPHAQQFVWQPAPRIELKEDLRSPNLLAFHAPHVEPPPKPKLFVPPPEAPKPAPETPALAPAPDVKSAANLAASPLAPKLARPKPLPFVPPVEAKKGPIADPKLEAPPPVEMAAGLSASARPPLNAELVRPARPAFVPPTATHGDGKPSPFGPPLPAAPELSGMGPAGPVSAAIVGLNPSAPAAVPLPQGSRDAQFSAGPHPRATGGAEGGGNGSTLVVPGLLVHGNPADAQSSKPVLVARAAAPTSMQNLRAAVHASVPDAAPAEAPNPAAVRVSSAPDPILEGREIYAMTVQMPNVTSYSGSWMIWFAEREHVLGDNTPVTPPNPLRKVDPKYIAAAITDRVEGTVRLAAVIHADGHVDSVQLLRHLDDRLDHSAAEAIVKWQFAPALRKGKPVDVDAVIEIPFRLAPQTQH